MMTNDLIKKVEAGAKAHMLPSGSGKCRNCPYKHTDSCTMALAQDVATVISNLKGKHESTLLQEPVMILNIPNQKILSDPIDIRTTLKEAEALRKMADAGNKASEALRDVTKALHDLKEVFPDD